MDDEKVDDEWGYPHFRKLPLTGSCGKSWLPSTYYWGWWMLGLSPIWMHLASMIVPWTLTSNCYTNKIDRDLYAFHVCCDLFTDIFSAIDANAYRYDIWYMCWHNLVDTRADISSDIPSNRYFDILSAIVRNDIRTARMFAIDDDDDDEHQNDNSTDYMGVSNTTLEPVSEWSSRQLQSYWWLQPQRCKKTSQNNPNNFKMVSTSPRPISLGVTQSPALATCGSWNVFGGWRVGSSVGFWYGGFLKIGLPPVILHFHGVFFPS